VRFAAGGAPAALRRTVVNASSLLKTLFIFLISSVRTIFLSSYPLCFAACLWSCQYRAYAASTGRILINHELESIWKEEVVVLLRYCPGIWPRVRKTAKMVLQDSLCPDRDSNEALPKYRLERYRLLMIYSQYSLRHLSFLRLIVNIYNGHNCYRQEL
jgi:hypothetical protein